MPFESPYKLLMSHKVCLFPDDGHRCWIPWAQDGPLRCINSATPVFRNGFPTDYYFYIWKVPNKLTAQWQTQSVLHLEATMVLKTVHQGLRLLYPHKYQSTQSKILCIYLSCSQSQEGDRVWCMYSFQYSDLWSCPKLCLYIVSFCCLCWPEPKWHKIAGWTLMPEVSSLWEDLEPGS